jgi:tRNA threonylcarbamoyladenosine biosynthesis protein TsaB
MHLLAFDTSTDALSVAVMRSTPTGPLYWQHQGAGGAAASGSLIAAIMDLLRQADLRLQDLDAICFGSGPGSFTGLRTACSVAQGLAYGAGVPVLAVPSLLALAQSARAHHASQATQGCVSALLDARMDQVYAASYAFAGEAWTTVQDPGLLSPEQVAAWAQSADAALGADKLLLGALGAQLGPANETGLASGQDGAPLLAQISILKTPQGSLPWRAWAGNVFGIYSERLAAPAGMLCCDALPQAMAILQVAPALIKAGACVPPEQALPLYVRDKVAKTTGERALEKAAKAGIAHSEAATAAENIAQAAAHAPTPGT